MIQPNKRIIFHIDVNSAFISWEAVKRLKEGDDIDLRKIPSAVGGDPKSRTSIISAKSIPAKKYGIQVGESVSSALKKYPKLTIVAPNFELYKNNSKAFMDICREYSSIIEPFSIDECFIDLSGTEKIYGDPVLLAYEIKEKIKRELGFTVNIGIGSNKLLAKTASDFEKPDKVHTLFDNEIKDKYWPLDVENILFVGKKTSQKLHDLGIYKIYDLTQQDIKKLIGWFGKNTAYSLRDKALGIDNEAVNIQKADIKSKSQAITLEYDITTSEKAFLIIHKLADELCRKLRQENLYASVVSLTLRSNIFKDKRRQHTLVQPTNTTAIIEKEAIIIFKELWDHKTAIRLFSLSLSDLSKPQDKQLSLFTETNIKEDREHKIDITLDEIKNKYGKNIIYRGISDKNKFT